MPVAAQAAALAVDRVLAGDELAAGEDLAADMGAGAGRGHRLDLDGHGGLAVGEHDGLEEGVGLRSGAGQSGQDEGELDDLREMHLRRVEWNRLRWLKS